LAKYRINQNKKSFVIAVAKFFRGFFSIQSNSIILSLHEKIILMMKIFPLKTEFLYKNAFFQG